MRNLAHTHISFPSCEAFCFVLVWFLFCLFFSMVVVREFELGFALARQVLPLGPRLESFFALVILEIGSHFFFPGRSGPRLSYFTFSAIPRMTGMYHQTQRFLLRWGLMNFCTGWPQTENLPISASQVARISSVSHRHSA
jgi:hypothetical protein